MHVQTGETYTKTQVRGMRTQPVSCRHVISYPKKFSFVLILIDKTDIGFRVYIANIFTFTTLIDRFTSCVCVHAHQGYKVTNL